MRKIFSIVLAAVLVLTGGLVTAFADTNAAGDQQIIEINIDRICTLLWAGEKPEFSVEIDPESLQKIEVVSEKWVGLRYMSTNKNIATVSKNGTITAKKKGTCSIYVYAQNGVFKRIKVTVK